MSAATWVLLCLAGGLGAGCRFEVDARVSAWAASRARHRRERRRDRTGADPQHPVPLGTIAVNATACLLLGLLSGWSALTSSPAPLAARLTAVLGTGFLGGYSTFSTASVEAARLLLAGRARAAAAHSGIMVALSVAALTLGMLVGGGLAT